ncbi:uncharacterized protein LOC143452742 [Clavelina lepadiformis]|uniref:uncharacterized protein LOC143452742 n=1 Tax=Clavelina lepadiformis TaxID=159417 RepID=UPI004042EB5F
MDQPNSSIGLPSGSESVVFQNSSDDVGTNTKEQYGCPFKQCTFTTNWKSSLGMHMKTHTDERPFQCALCNKHFKLKHHLKHHILTHSQYKPFKCHLCDYRTSDSYCLQRHKVNKHRLQVKRPKRSSLPTMVSAFGQVPFQTDHENFVKSFTTADSTAQTVFPAKSPLSFGNSQAFFSSVSATPLIRRTSSLSSVGQVVTPSSDQATIHPKILQVHSAGDTSSLHSEVRRKSQNDDIIQIPDDLDKAADHRSISSPESIPVTVKEELSTDRESPEVSYVRGTNANRWLSTSVDNGHSPGSSKSKSVGRSQSELFQSASFPPSVVKNNAVKITKPESLELSSKENVTSCKSNLQSVHSDLISRRWRCVHCEIVFPDNIMYGLHMGCHAVGRPFQCNVCGNICKDKHDFMFHFTIGRHLT